MNCQKCGACCASSSEEEDLFVEVTRRDGRRLGSAYLRRHTTVDDLGVRTIIPKWKRQRAGPLKGLNVLVCPSLRGSVLHQVSCAVYDRRPSACRGFRPAKKVCQGCVDDLVNQKEEISR